MKIEKINPNIKYVYHYTLKENVKKILNDKKIKSKDNYVFFTKNLKDSINAFESEMLNDNKLYIDLDGNLRKREKCNKNDYCILKIPYINDNQFYEFKFPNQKEDSIYSISLTHKGSYTFKSAKVLEIPNDLKPNFFNKFLFNSLILTTSILLLPYNVYASSWLDSNNYDISWYSKNDYFISNAKELAGLAYLVNNNNITFTGKSINITKDIDLTENTWETIKDIFNGTICGSHRILLNYNEKFMDGNDINIVQYSYKILLDSDNYQNIIVNSPYTIKELKNSIGPNTSIFLNNKELDNNLSLFDIKLNDNDIIEAFTNKYFIIKNSNGENVPLYFESGDSIYTIKLKYSKKTNANIDKIVLKYNDKLLDDEKTIADYNISKFQVIDLYSKYDITSSVVEGKGSITVLNNVIENESVIVTIKEDDGYEISKVIVNGIDKTNEVNNNILNIKNISEDIDIKVSYKIKENNNLIEESKEVITNPKTYDNICLYLISFIISLISIIISNMFIKKKVNNNK